ncbi:hypothetical protein [Rhizobium sp. GN54]|uniref:hypothetical protein n=1 Tax=Rhizobium sp. GN54 TaxID=2898150 RepID=UPI001E599D86|nr:hypothetical protein [Rhizobium sp. GN54]MCD2185240.1 hypothetical protein [Rhizobium sp. GN54]
MRIGLFICVLAATVQPALATEVDEIALMMTKLVGTQSVAFRPQSQNGQLIGCTLEFDALVRDWKYRNGGFLKLAGSFGILAPGGANVGAMQKLTVSHLDYSGLELQVNPSSPSRLFMRDREFRSNIASLVNATESDAPGSFFAVYNLSPTMEIILAGIERGEIVIGFNQMNGESDIELDLQLDVASMDNDGNRTKSTDARRGFMACLMTLSERLK